MIVGLLTLEIYIPYSHSLKEKRKALNSLKDRLKKKFNIALAELDYQSKWQRALIGMVTINNQKRVIESLFEKILQDTEKNLEGQILRSEINYF